MSSTTTGMSTSGLCLECQRFVQDGYRESNHYGILGHLKLSAEPINHPACSLCVLLWASIQAQHSASVSTSSVDTILNYYYVLDLAYGHYSRPPKIQIRGAVMMDGTRPVLSTLDATPIEIKQLDLSIHNPNRRPTVSGNTWTPQIKETVLSWLGTCNNEHPWCGRIEPKSAPTRLVDISDPDNYRLVETKGGQKELYVALSYVWGEKKNGESVHKLKLKKATRADLKRGMKPHLLTASHREGITVARELGLRYIWIDALCILQDDDDDWKDAALEVPEVYGNAALTITIGKSHDSREGFLDKLQPVDLPYQANGTACRLEISLATSRAIGPTDQRAWCFQESILSRRNLVFGIGQVFLRCRKRKDFQDGSDDPHMFEEPAIEHDWILPHPPEVARGENDRLRRTQGDVARGWYRIAQQYSIRDMFDPFDCYAALAGIARRCEKALAKAARDRKAPRYLAGVWETDTFPHALMWRRSLEAESADHCQPLVWPVSSKEPVPVPVQRAPSWSWMSVVGRMTFHCAPILSTGATTSMFHRRPCCSPAGRGGAWSSGSWGVETPLTTKEIQRSLPLKIDVIARLHQVRATNGVVRNFMMDLKVGEIRHPHSTITSAEQENLKEHGVVLQDVRNPEDEKGIALALFDQWVDRNAIAGTQFWALPVLTLSTGDGSWHVPSEGLLLSRNRNGVYSRVGVFWIRDAEVFMNVQEQCVSIE